MTKAFGLTIRKMFIDNKRIFIRFIVSLTVCIALIGYLLSSEFVPGRYAVGGFVGDEKSYRGRRLAVA